MYRHALYDMKEDEADGSLQYARRPMFLINNLNTILTHLANQRKEDRAASLGLGPGSGVAGLSGRGSGKAGGSSDAVSTDELIFLMEQK